MKRISIICMFLWIWLDPVHAQTNKEFRFEDFKKILDQVQRKSDVKTEKDIIRLMYSWFSDLDEKDKELIDRNLLEKKLTGYFLAKKSLGFDKITNENQIKDFSWKALISAEDWVAVRFANKDLSPHNIATGTYARISVSDDIAHGSGPGDYGEVVPLTDDEVTFEFQAGIGVRTNTSAKFSGEFKEKSWLQSPSSNNAAKINVESKPEGAKLYFNNKLYHSLTNVTSIQPPGKIKVEIKKENCVSWSDEKLVKAGDTWNITKKLDCK